jgi:hypothetical protein
MSHPLNLVKLARGRPTTYIYETLTYTNDLIRLTNARE